MLILSGDYLLVFALFAATCCNLTWAKKARPKQQKNSYEPASGKRGMCYKVVDGKGTFQSWNGALNACKNEGGTLANFVDQAEYNGLMKAFSKNSVRNPWKYRYWLGYSDRASAGNWVDTSGQVMNTFAHSKWISQWPKPAMWRCLTIMLSQGNRFNTRQCHMKRPYVCMKKCKQNVKAPKVPKYRKFYSPGGGRGKCFKAVYNKMTQPQAESYCKKENGQLAYFSDRKEMNHMRILMRNEHRPGQAFWVDGTDVKVEGQFKFSDQCSMNGYMMQLFKPRRKGDKFDCLSVHYTKHQPKITNVKCSQRRRFVCMYNCGPCKGPNCNRKCGEGSKTTVPAPATITSAMTTKPAPATVTADITTTTADISTTTDETPNIKQPDYKPGYTLALHGKRGKCYKAVGEKLNQVAANHACKADGGDAMLANFVDVVEYTHMVDLMTKSDVKGNFWMDGTALNTPLKFRFTDGSDFSYANTKFAEGAPDNWPNGKGAEFCLEMNGKESFLRHYLNDQKCSIPRAYFCMYTCEKVG